MIRAAAKNHDFVTVIVDPADYEELRKEFTTHNGAACLDFRRRMARKAYARTAAYDTAISTWMAREEGEPFPERVTIAGARQSLLRYGENPHRIDDCRRREMQHPLLRPHPAQLAELGETTPEPAHVPGDLGEIAADHGGRQRLCRRGT
jgi:AICAR transformylase/IMP cyclohydrolase PurH